MRSTPPLTADRRAKYRINMAALPKSKAACLFISCITRRSRLSPLCKCQKVFCRINRLSAPVRYLPGQAAKLCSSCTKAVRATHKPVGFGSTDLAPHPCRTIRFLTRSNLHGDSHIPASYQKASTAQNSAHYTANIRILRRKHTEIPKRNILRLHQICDALILHAQRQKKRQTQFFQQETQASQPRIPHPIPVKPRQEPHAGNLKRSPHQVDMNIEDHKCSLFLKLKLNSKQIKNRKFWGCAAHPAHPRKRRRNKRIILPAD